MQDFKDKKSGEWDPDYWICLACDKDVVVIDEELIVLVDKDQVVQGQDEDAAMAIVMTTKVIDLLVETGPITKQLGAVDQGTE